MVIYPTLVPWTGWSTNTPDIFSAAPTRDSVIASSATVTITGPELFKCPSRVRVVTSAPPVGRKPQEPTWQVPP
jgi:hypothetical protein